MVTNFIMNSKAKVKMCVLKFCAFIFCALMLNCDALNCRSDGGPKEDELKKIYTNCAKKHDGKNSNDSRGFQEEDQDWKDSRRQNHWSQRDDGTSRRDGRLGRDRDETGDRDFGTGNDRATGKEKGDRYNNMRGKNDRKYNRDETMSDRDDRMANRDERFGKDGLRLSVKDDFLDSDEFRGDISSYTAPNYRTSTQPSRRYKRERRLEINSGHRSQYNPNTNSRGFGYEDSYSNNEKNSSEDTSKEDSKGCVLHCFLEELEMTGDNGLPDKYLVTHTITKDVKNEDLRDFLQESIEECFQILYNENSEDKCEFSKNLLMCLSEKGRANCDDWNDDLRF